MPTVNVPNRPLALTGPVATGASVVLGLVLAALGGRMLVLGHMMPLFGGAMVVIGVLGVLLAIQSWRGHRAAWAFLVALWGVVAFCAFFAAPEVISLDHLKQVTPEMELSLGRERAESVISDQNLNIRLLNLAVCALFAAPFAAACALLARRSGDPEASGATAERD